ncbi:sigma 54-interacting transcriptional regulator [Altererythrobacter sp. H2]|uniref:sigma-54 interaction domain-containing protein n=1 Tax=Altererythrobacter sp. H2 TaxID=3108391 RepID=UPI002B4BC956|nr:sigma 54-interacting transcriptional regulator [Altererythrobacter sp. H2]WRK96950.1 sigma 54-interacting transcriptional regulator [Altererythrobacter sp. H2]
MIRNRATETMRQRHPALIASLHSLPAGLANDAPVLCCDDEPLPPRRGGTPVVVVGQGCLGGIARNAGGLTAFTPDPHDADGTRAALLAAMAPAGMPIAADPATLALLALAERVAASEIPVLVEGPTGTGKEVLARFLHSASPRSEGPFVAVNCAAMPEAMLEALLFGHRKGAFTGASESHEGFFRAAHGGTLLLDEIGELPLALQSKLLRALQEGEVVPLGATAPVKVDVRVVACTNRHLPREVEAGRFREDLYYRLNVFPLRLSALRDRPQDIAPLAFAMLLRHGGAGSTPRWIAPEALAMLRVHPWPGNVRELENVIRRALLLAGDRPLIAPADIRFDAPARAVGDDAACPPAQKTRSGHLSDIAFRSEADAIQRVLDECGGHRGDTARRLGISERTLRYRLAQMRDSGLVAAAGGRA